MLTANQLKYWVSIGKIKEALDALHATSDGETRNEILQIIARYNEYNRQRRLGLSNSADSGVELAHIRQALLENIDRFVQHGTTVFLYPQNVQQENSATEAPRQSLMKKNVTILALMGLLFFLVFLYCFSIQKEPTLNNPDPKLESPLPSSKKGSSSSNENRDKKKDVAQPFQGHKFSVIVLDSLDNKRIDNAKVRVGENDEKKYTREGRAEFEINATGMIKIHVEKEGFKSRVEWLSPTEDVKEIKIVKQ